MKNLLISGILCAVQSCKASKRTHPERKFFKFPTDQSLCDIWIEKCALNKSNLRKNLKICDKHFNTECIRRRKLIKNSIPEYYLNDPHIRSENETPTIKTECYDFTSSRTLSDPMPTPFKEDITNNLKRFTKLINYYKGQINFLKNEIRKHQTNKSEIKQIDELPNLGLAAKELGKIILNDSTRVWPCLNCMEVIKIGIQSKKDTKNSDDVLLNKTEGTISNFESDCDKNSVTINTELANFTFEQFYESSDLDAAAIKPENDNEALTIEQSNIVAPEKYECEKCKEKFDTYKQLIYHKRIHPDINLYECERCGKEFHHGSRYRDHAVIYKSVKSSICKICNKGFKCLKHLRQHELTHKTEKIHPCPYCDKCFCHKKGLNHHLVNHKEKRIQCPKCHKKFQYNSQLKLHYDLVHEPRADGKSITTRKVNGGNRKPTKHVKKMLQKRFACEKCGKLFFAESTMKSHIKFVHNKESPSFLCSYCSKAFRFSASLTCHMQHHINSKDAKIDPKTIESYLKYKCDECDKAFTTQHFLKNHKVIHSGSKEYVCAQCGKGFAFKNYLKRHIRLVHDPEHPKNFVCGICRKVSANVWALKSHMLSHTGETPFQCKSCNSKFRYEKSLRLHLKNKHNL